MVDLLDIIGAVTPLRKFVTTKGGGWSGPCPFCKEGTDRFYVYPYAEHPYWCCRVCNVSGDPRGWYMKYVGLSYEQAGEAVGLGNAPQKPRLERSKPKPFSVDESALTVSPQMAEDAWIAGRAKAIDYYAKYKLTPKIVDRFRLGYMKTDYGLSGFSIPHTIHTTETDTVVVGIKIRRDDMVCPQFDKYMSVKGSSLGGIFNDKWVSAPDGSRIGPSLPYIFVSEDENTAMVLEQAGFPAVAYRERGDWQPYLDVIFRTIGLVVILADNDPKANGVWPGRDYAMKIFNAMTRDRIVITCNTHKQFADLAAETSIENVRHAVAAALGVK